MSRRVGYHWHLRRVMAAHDLWKTTDLGPLLRERGVNLSAAQVYRLVTDKPERLSLQTLSALCDIFGCSPADLVEPYVEPSFRQRTAGNAESGAAVTDLHAGLNPGVRPARARIVDDENT